MGNSPPGVENRLDDYTTKGLATMAHDKDETSTTTTTPAPEAANEAPKSAKATKAQAQEAAQKAAGTSEFSSFAHSAQAATGQLVEVPKTPEEIAAQGTKLGASGDHSTGGFNDPFANPGRRPEAAPDMTRVWAMDADHTTNNRHLPDSLKPDCSVEA
jgi:hypothetical protein